MATFMIGTRLAATLYSHGMTRSRTASGFVCLGLFMLIGLGTSCGSNATTDATTSSSTAAGAAPSPTTASGAAGAASENDFCAMLAAQAVELGKRLSASSTAASDPDFQAYSAKSNKDILEAAPASVSADIKTVFDVAEGMREATASGGDIDAAAAAASTPEFTAASDRYIAWVNENCSADQASQIVGLGAGN